MSDESLKSKPIDKRWELTPHICRVCFGRVLKHVAFDHRKTYKCSNCETEVIGSSANCLCCCGISLRTQRDAGIRCVINNERTPENPSIIVAEQVAPPKN